MYIWGGGFVGVKKHADSKTIINCYFMKCKHNKNGFCKLDMLYIGENGRCENMTKGD